jgi:hypothetical protein
LVGFWLVFGWFLVGFWLVYLRLKLILLVCNIFS